MQILVVDDDREIVELLNIYLKNEQYDVLKAYNGKEALQVLEEHPDVDLIVLDLMMPEMTGEEVLAHVREHYGAVPVIVLSAKSADNDKIKTLIGGADDYVTKPFNPLEVIARIKSIMRRQATQAPAAQSTETIEIGPLVINKASHSVQTVDGTDIQLTAIEFNILYLLASHPNQVFNAEEIFAEVWEEEVVVSAKTVMVHVSHLRDKIAKATDGEKVIETVWGVGYKING